MVRIEKYNQSHENPSLTWIMGQTNFLQMAISTQYPSEASGSLRSNPVVLKIQLLDVRLATYQWAAQQPQYRGVHSKTIEVERRYGYVAVVQTGDVSRNEGSDALVLDALLPLDLEDLRKRYGVLDQCNGYVPHFMLAPNRGSPEIADNILDLQTSELKCIVVLSN